MLFGYDFNFFHLISFKKNKTATESPRKSSSAALEYKKEDLLKILSLLKNESEKLSINLPTYEQVKKFNILVWTQLRINLNFCQLKASQIFLSFELY